MLFVYLFFAALFRFWFTLSGKINLLLAGGRTIGQSPMKVARSPSIAADSVRLMTVYKERTGLIRARQAGRILSRYNERLP